MGKAKVAVICLLLLMGIEIRSSSTPKLNHSLALSSWMDEWNGKSLQDLKHLCVEKLRADHEPQQVTEKKCKEFFTENREKILTHQIHEWLPALQVHFLKDHANTQIDHKIRDWMNVTPLRDWLSDPDAQEKIYRAGSDYLNEQVEFNQERLPASNADQMKGSHRD